MTMVNDILQRMPGVGQPQRRESREMLGVTSKLR
jgi:hypothetical protein